MDEVFIRLNIEADAAIKQQAELEKSIIETNAALKDLTAATKGDTEAQKAAAGESLRLKNELRKLKGEQNEVTKTIVTATKATKANDNTIEAMRLKVSALTVEWKKADIGSDKFKELAKELDETTEELKEFESAVGKNQRNVGNYIKEIEIAGMSVNSFTDENSKAGKALGLVKGSFTKGAGAAKIFKIALASTGVGLIVVALGSLVTWLSKSQTGIDMVTKVTDQASAAMDVIIDRITKFGGGLAKILSGDFTAGFDEMKDSFKGVGEEISNDVSLAGDLADRMVDLQEKELALSKQRGTTLAQMAELKLAAEDDTKSQAERQSAIKEAIRLSNELGAAENSLAMDRQKMAQEDLERSESTRADRAELVEIELQTQGVIKETADRMRELQALQKGLNAAQTEGAVQRQEQFIEEMERNTTRDQQTIESIGIVTETETDALATVDEAKLESAQADAANAAYSAEEQQAYDEQTKNMKKAAAASVYSTVKMFAKKGSKLSKAIFLGEKAAALSSVIINTIKGVQAAIAGPPPAPWSIPIAASVGVMGAANAAKIVGTTVTGFQGARRGGVAAGGSAGYGGMTIGPSHADGGVPIMAEGGEGIINKRSMADTEVLSMTGRVSDIASALNTHKGYGIPFARRGGQYFADGGFVGRSLGGQTMQAAEQRNDLIDVIQSMPSPVVGVDDITAGLERVASVQEMANL